MTEPSDQENIEIVEYKDSYKEDIERLNYEWLQKYFRIEKGDELSLTNPQHYIINKGGYIFFARQNSAIVGTASLLKKTDDVYELGKMAVSASVQGRGVGKILLEYCLDFARKKGIVTLILYSNTQLQAAIHLYRKYGFTEIELEPGLYERANIKMCLQL